MGFINSTLSSFKTAFSPKLDWKGGAENLNSTFGKNREIAVIASDADDQEIKIRYRNVQIAAWSSVFFCSVSIITIPFSSSYRDFLISSTAAVLFMLFYFRYAYILWVCRKSWKLGLNLEDKVSFSVKDFCKAFGEDLSEAAPLALPKKGVKK